MKTCCRIISCIAFFSLFCMKYVRWDYFIFLMFLFFLILMVFGGWGNASLADEDSFYNRKMLYFKGSAIFIESIGLHHFFSSGVLCDLGRRLPYLNTHLASLVVGFLCVIIGYPFAVTLMHSITPFILTLFRLCKTRRKELLSLTGLHILAISAILRANVNYVDDVGRVLNGYQMAGDYSRYLSNLIATCIHGNYYLTDTSPLPQLIAAFILSVSGVIYLDIFLGEETNSPMIFRIAAVVPLGLSPYFLNCLSYKYDAPYMAFSVLFSILPLLFRFRISYSYVLIAMYSTIAMCLTYQASSGIFPMTVLVISLIQLIEGKKKVKDILHFVLKSAGGYIAGILTFYFVLAEPVPTDRYVGTSVNLKNLPRNLQSFSRWFYTDMTLIWRTLIIIIAVCFVVELVRRSKNSKILNLLLSIIGLCLMYIFSFGAYLFLDKSCYAVRYMYGIGILLSLMMLTILRDFGWNVVGNIAALMLSWLFITYAFTYGNALSAQKEYTDFRTTILADDLSKIVQSNGSSVKKGLQISGTIGLAKNVENITEQYPLIKRSLRVMLAEDYWGKYSLLPYYRLDSSYYLLDGSIDSEGLETIISSTYHEIMGDNNNVFVVLK